MFFYGAVEHSYEVILKIWDQINLQFLDKVIFLTTFTEKTSVFGLSLARVSLGLYLYKIC